MLSQLLCAVARRVESHAPLACFLASGHLCSCLYNSSAWRERMKNTLFFPLTRLLFSIMLHLSRGKYILETLRLGRELNPDVTFSGQAFEVFGYSTKRGSRSSNLGVIDGLSDSRDGARCSGFADVKCLCQRSGGTQEEPGVQCSWESFLLLGQRHGEDIAQLDTTTALLLVSHRGMVTPSGQRMVILFAEKCGKNNLRH